MTASNRGSRDASSAVDATDRHLPLPDFAARRAKFMAALSKSTGFEGKDSVVLLFSPPHATRNSDVEHPYRADSDIYWLTGFEEPNATLVLLPGRPEGETVLFLRPRDPAKEVWTGRRLGIERAPDALGVNEAFDAAELDKKLPTLLHDRPNVFVLLAREPTEHTRVLRALAAVRNQSRRFGRHPSGLHDVAPVLHSLRLHKDEADIAALTRAVEVSAAGHVRAMRAATLGMNERDLEAELSYVFLRQGAPRHGYSPIVAAGNNACILHYEENNAPIADHALVLIDAGAEIGMASGDITRTWPVCGRFTPPQRDVYEIVLAANEAAINIARPGTGFWDVDDVARRVLAEGLRDLKLLRGEVDSLVERVRADGDAPWVRGKAPLDRFYPHSTSHWLGLDVHDVGAYHDGNSQTALAPSMAFTIEPGLYLDGDDVPEEFRGIGIRIEDDVLVTADGPRVLSEGAPKSTRALEALIGTETGDQT